MATIAISTRTVQAAEPGRHYDTKLAGFGLYVGKTGTRSYFFEYRPGYGRSVAKKRMTIGKHGQPWTAEQARRKALELASIVASGRDPLAEKLTSELASAALFETVAATWLELDQADKRSVKEVRRIVDRYIAPAWRKRDIAEITRGDVITLLDDLAKTAPVMSNRVLSAVHRLFAWAKARDLVASNPAEGVERRREHSRDRVLNDRELVAVWRASHKLGTYGAIVRLLILTAARREEIASLAWGEVDLDRGLIVLPAERSKNGEARDIPLSAAAVSIIEQQPRIEGPYLFGTASGGRRPYSGFSKSKAQLDEYSGVSGWRLHDLRRTSSTILQSLGIRLEVTEALIGHTAGSRSGIVAVYQRHQYGRERREAVEALAAYLDRLLNSSSDVSQHGAQECKG